MGCNVKLLFWSQIHCHCWQPNFELHVTSHVYTYLGGGFWKRRNITPPFYKDRPAHCHPYLGANVPPFRSKKGYCICTFLARVVSICIIASFTLVNYWWPLERHLKRSGVKFLSQRSLENNCTSCENSSFRIYLPQYPSQTRFSLQVSISIQRATVPTDFSKLNDSSIWTYCHLFGIQNTIMIDLFYLIWFPLYPSYIL